MSIRNTFIAYKQAVAFCHSVRYLPDQQGRDAERSKNALWFRLRAEVTKAGICREDAPATQIWQAASAAA